MIAYIGFLQTHHRFPLTKNKKRLINDELYRVKTGTEIENPLRVFTTIDLHKILCESLSKCSNFDGVNIYSYDGNHLTPYGAKILGERLFMPDSDFE